MPDTFDLFQLYILNSETGVKIKSPDVLPILAFENARRTGWSDDPRDAGGATMCGVTLNTLRAWCARHKLPTPTKDILRAITYSTWRDILREFFWDNCKADRIKAPQIAYIIVDWVWASGPAVIKKIQTLLKVNPDGIIGPRTLAAINAADQEKLFDTIFSMRLAYIEAICKSRPANLTFRRGWINRLNRITNTPPYLKIEN